jgi:AP-3 complex subunit beta
MCILTFQDLENEKFYPDSQGSEEDDDDDEDDDEEGDEEQAGKKKPYVMDPDHRLLLRVTKPLLQSRNATVSFCFIRLL